MQNSKVLVLTPATVRPRTIQRTYQSFTDNMFNHCEAQVSLGIHIDSVGGICNRKVCRTAYDIRLLSDRYFDVFHSHTNYNKKKSLAGAFYHLWALAVRSHFDYVFYLEDDWELLYKVDLDDMITIMQENPTLATLRLPFRPTQENSSKNWTHRFPWNGRYFECPADKRDNIGWCGHPSLVSMEFVKATFPVLRIDLCPELQMKGKQWSINPQFTPIIRQFNYGVYGQPDSPATIRDIGREWRVKRGYEKDKIHTNWIRKENDGH